MTARAEQWETGFAHLREFAERNGHARMPVKFKTEDGYSLGQWVSNQRRARTVMDAERVERLEALPGWTWDAYTSRWEEAFAYLKMYVAREGHARVLLGFKTTEGYPLGAWVSTQRGRAAMPPERAARLEALTGWGLG